MGACDKVAQVRTRFLAVLWLSGCGVLGAPGAGGPEPWAPLGEWIGSERARLAELAAGLGEDGEEIAAELAGVAETAEAGRLLLAAERLSSPRLGAEARAYRSERRGSVADLPTLEAEARHVGSEIGRLDARATGSASGPPAALRALSDAAWVRGRAYHGAAVSYARVTSVSAGLFYLGAARSLAATAADLAGLAVAARAPGAGPSAEALEAELAELDRRTIAAYRAPGAEVEQHSAFIALNAEVKEARDLLAAGRPVGALLAALESRRRLEAILDDGAEAAPELGRRAASFRDRCEAAAWDASLGRLFVERAEDALAAEVPNPRSLREARAVLLHVLPRYFELHEETP